MMENEQTEDEGIEMITEWPVTSSSDKDDSHTQTSLTSGGCHSVCLKPKTDQRSSLAQLRLGKRHHHSDHRCRGVSTEVSLETQREKLVRPSNEDQFSIETFKFPRKSDSGSTDCADKPVLGKSRALVLKDAENFDESGEESISAVNSYSFPQQNCAENSDSQLKREYSSAERELLAQPRIARWWRRQGRRLTSSQSQEKAVTLPTTTNPNTLLFHVARLPEGRAFLEDEHQKLKREIDTGKGRADVMAALGSIEDWLGNVDNAVQYLKHAVAKEPDNKEWRWLLHKVERQQRARRRQRELLPTVPANPVFPAARQVDRVSCRDLSFADFFHQYAVRRRPVIITDMVFSMTTVPWDLQHIRDVAGEVEARVKRSVAGSVEWAGLEDSGLLTVSQFLDRLQEGCRDYLFDWSLPLHCPALADELTIPRYFTGDFLQRSAAGSLYQDSWPSLFIAPAGVHSGLHVDAFASNFWMALFQGRKRWVFFQEEDTPCLYPVYAHSLDPSFEGDVADPDLSAHPLLACVHPMECVLEAGELLFVPGGSPHYVENLETTLAISANFVDLSNFGRVLEELDVSALLDPRAADLVWQFQQPSFVSHMKLDIGDMPWKEFKTWPPPDLDSYRLKRSECESINSESAQ
ncbi:uncharacterized protein LOC143289129 [Babylonia areolata]|uniref:uncharacterized protein LOC143289129 n=1 Tax=Babylonia areolata TaxID=304850 RepID=UPI003FD068A8